MLDPKLEEILNNLLAALREKYDTPAQRKIFYQFVVMAYRLSEEKRPSVPKFTDILREAGIPKPGSLAVLYAHGLYMLAMHDGYGLGLDALPLKRRCTVRSEREAVYHDHHRKRLMPLLQMIHDRRSIILQESQRHLGM